MLAPQCRPDNSGEPWGCWWTPTVLCRQREKSVDVLNERSTEAAGNPHKQPLVSLCQRYFRRRSAVQGQGMSSQSGHQSKACSIKNGPLDSYFPEEITALTS